MSNTKKDRNSRFNSGTAPSWFSNIYNRRDRAKTRNSLVKVDVKLEDDSDLEFTYNHKHSASWDYW